MKNLLFIAAIALFASCEPQAKKQYDFEIITTNGDTLYQSYIGVGNNLFSLKNGDLTTRSFSRTLMSGVRSYRVERIKNLGMQTQAEADADPCGCELIPVNN